MIPDKKDLDDDPDVKEAKEEDYLIETEKKPPTPTAEKQARLFSTFGTSKSRNQSGCLMR